MGLFSRKKEAQKTGVPSLPEFKMEDVPEFPTYKPAIKDIKREVQRSAMPRPMVDMPEIPRQNPEPRYESDRYKSEDEEIMQSSQKGPLFVKVSQYRSAMQTLNELKAKISEAERIMAKFDELKAKEDEQLEKWKAELEDIKDKLLSVDKSLFEV